MKDKPEIALAAGVILVAPPVLVDPNFRRAVVFLCEHSSEGSFGLILNHDISLGMSELVDELSSFPDSVRIGGPVQLDTLHFLHRYGDAIPGALEIADGIFWGGEITDLQHLLDEQKPSGEDLRFFLGYAGWTEDQLENEINAGGWLLLPPNENLVFDVDPSALWRESMLLLGGEYKLLVNFPDNPLMN